MQAPLRSFWPILLLVSLLGLAIGANPPPPLSNWPAPPASAIVPNADQIVEIVFPLPGQSYTSAGYLHVEYRTGDGIPAELYVDGLRVPNRSEIALFRYPVGTHKIRVNPLMHPEKAKEVSFQIVPAATLKDAPDAIEIALDMDPFSAAHLDTGSLKLVSVNG